MERSGKGHMEEAVNLRSFYLRLLQKIWILPLAAVIGAVICAGIYTLATVTFGPGKTYSARARLYISFAYDENTGTLVDYYNAYTWKNMLMPTDEILDPIIEYLSEDGVVVTDGEGNASEPAGSKVITKDQLIASMDADIPSDVRVMLLTASNSDKTMAEVILKAAVKSLENYGVVNDAFDSIKRLSMDEEAKLDTYTDRTIVAAVFGAVCGAVIAILLLMLCDALDDAVYIPEDAEKRYKLPVLGITTDGNDVFFKNELKAAYEKIVSGAEKVAVISVDSIDNSDISEKDAEALKETIGENQSEKKTELIPLSVPGSVLDNYRKIGTSDGVILCIPYGSKKGAMTEHVLAQLKKHDCPVLGLLIVRASGRFLRRYYGLKEKNGK